jgi:hypothetical protein
MELPYFYKKEYNSMNYQNMKLEDIINWCKENKQVAWLKATAAITYPTEDGGSRKITFIELKKEFAEKFMPEIMPKAKEKKPSMYDIIAAL